MNVPEVGNHPRRPVFATANSFRVIAIIAAFNEGDMISAVIGHLVKNGIEVYLIDNHSTDDTVEQARTWLGRGLIDIETFPNEQCNGKSFHSFDWTSLLKRKEELASQLTADWFIHHDADEIRETPWPGVTLREAIQWVDFVGYNCIDFRTFNFLPVDDGFRQGDDPTSYFGYYENAAEFDKLQLKCWKGGRVPVSLVPSGGHDVEFPGRRIFPLPFVLRHYPIRGQTHGIRKVFSERKNRLLEREHSQGWHIQYDDIADEKHTFLRNPGELIPFNLEIARLELMMPNRTTSELAERLLRTDEEMIQLRSQQKEAEGGLEEYRRHANNLERVREELGQRVSELEQERADDKVQIANLHQGLQEYERHARELERVREELGQQVMQLEQQGADDKAQISNLQQGLEEYQRRGEELERIREELGQRVMQLEQQGADDKAQIGNLQQGLEEYQRRGKELERIREELGKRLSEIEQERADLKSYICSVARGLEAYERHSNNLEHIREELGKRIAELEQERADLKGYIVRLERGLAEYRDHTGNLERVRQELTEETHKLGAARKEAMERLQQCETSVAMLKDELSAIGNSRSWRWTAPLRRLHF